jgi:DNA helicase-4
MLGLARTYRPSLRARLFFVDGWKLALDPRCDAHLVLREQQIPCLDLTSVTVTKALLWHTVEIRTSDR